MQARFQVVQRNDDQLAFQVKPAKAWSCLILAIFGVNGVFTLLGYGIKLESQGQMVAIAITSALFILGGFLLVFHRSGIILDKESRKMVEWTRWYGIGGTTEHAWDEIDQVIVSCSNKATSSGTSATEYPILLRAGLRRHRLVWPWAFGSRQDAIQAANEMASFMGKAVMDSSIKGGWSTPQEEHLI